MIKDKYMDLRDKKYCSGCKEHKPFEDFPKSGNRRRCLACRKDKFLQRTYGITLKEYERMLKEQEGRCALCGTKSPSLIHNPLHVDHNHQTGVVRGLLCNICNRGLERIIETGVSRYMGRVRRYLKKAGEL